MSMWRVGIIVFMLMWPLTAVACQQPTPPPLPTATPMPDTPTPPPPPPFRIIGYVTEEIIVETIPFDKLTHINYAFLIPNADGTFARLLNPWKLKAIVAEAHTQDVKVLISVGGWGWDTQFEELAANPETRATFITGLVNFAEEYNLDGLDIDWEYPDPGTSSQNFLALMQELRAALPPDKLLTIATVAQGETGAGIPVETFSLLDFLNIMAYDGSETDHSPFSYAESSLDYWRQRGLPAEKLVLGVPFYGRPNWIPYRELIEADSAAANADTLDYQGETVYYNGIATMQEKTRLAMAQGSGIMFWALPHDTTDTTSLLSAIFNAAHEGSGSP